MTFPVVLTVWENFADYSNFRARLLKLVSLRYRHESVSRSGASRLYRFNAEAFAPFKDKPLVFI